MGLPEGWYFHTDFPGFARYWDGQEWTAHLRPAEPPIAPPGSVPTPPTGSNGSEQHTAYQGTVFAGSPVPNVMIANDRVLILSDEQKVRLAIAGAPQFGPAWYHDPLSDSSTPHARYWNGRQWTGRRATIRSDIGETSPMPNEKWRNL
jgi:hypothetical protein